MAQGQAGAGPWVCSCCRELGQSPLGGSRLRVLAPGKPGETWGHRARPPFLGAPVKMDIRAIAKGLASPDAWQRPLGAWRAAPELGAWLSCDLELSVLFYNQLRERPL